MNPFTRFFAALLIAAPVATAGADQPDTSALFDHELRRLHSPEIVNLRERLAGQPLLVINTASHCGYTGQFGGLEELHQRYRDAGLKVVGFPSNDFNQESDDEAVTARVCFENFGVSFDMFAPVGVRGEDAHPIFRELARQSEAPRWNFHKYVVDRDGRVVAHFPSRVGPNSRDLQRAIESVL
ncbi:MAG TPA: glutathione peroxidase [Azoarcus taiwanensis]|uniref:Glutathione peroxidase n=1 Tax=Azoarcus taiwanensis TaxID=666964 RepID=A0A972FK14_9RHOO|nr:glutathione peroxidase [Azoarcus taiwanensis]NMG03721.1 glutathione peroxidase [Azoarcus taiwanensis]HRQ57007.1 glutathione peroxidase [Azoarcus taiwanensis]